MTKSLKVQVTELKAELAALTAKLRGQIAQANRYFERNKLLEIQNRELLAILREHGLDSSPTLTTVQSLRAQFMELSKELGMTNVRIIRGQLEIRRNNEWQVA